MNNGFFAPLRLFCACAAIAIALTLSATPALAKLAPPGTDETMPLPIVLPDEQGVRWDIQPDGSIADGGNDLYDGGGHLYLEDNQPWTSSGPASFNRERNEVVLGPTSFRELNVTRRIAVNSKLGFCRWAEVFENPTAQKISISFRVHFDMGGSIAFVQPYSDEKHKGRVIGMAFGDQRHCIAAVGAGRGSKLLPRFEPQQGGDQFNMYYDLEVPPKQIAVIVHVQIYRQQFNAACAILGELKDKEYLAQLPQDLQRKVVNFRTADSAIGDLEILRGSDLDVIELRGGDMLRGQINQPNYRLHTFYGLLDLPVDKVISLINVGDFRPRQLLVMRDGEVFGGQLAQQDLTLKLSSGQEMRVPIPQVARAGYRRRSGEADEWSFARPMVFLRSGDRMEIKLPPTEIPVSTRYGILKLRPQIIASIAYQSEDQSVHEIHLTDGSRFAGLVLMNAYDMELAGQAPGQRVQFSAASIAKLQFCSNIDDPDDATPLMSLANGDSLVGTLQGQLRLETTFDTITISAGEIKRLASMKTSPADVQIILWDDSLVQGQLKDPMLNFLSTSNVPVRIPASLVEEYLQPRPKPTDAVIETIKTLVNTLNADDWQQRDAAQEKLIAMGPIALGTLKQLRLKEEPEAQQRIDLIIPILEKLGRNTKSLVK